MVLFPAPAGPSMAITIRFCIGTPMLSRYNSDMSLRSSLLTLCLAASLFAADAAVDAAKKQIAAKKYTEAIATLEPALKAKPKSVEVTKALSEAYTGKADVTMNNAALPPRQKYPEALRGFRKAVELDKDNKKAKEGAEMIEGIYKQMGRPVPQ